MKSINLNDFDNKSFLDNNKKSNNNSNNVKTNNININQDDINTQNTNSSKTYNKENGYDERVNKLIDTVNEKFKIVNREFSYSLHEKTNRYIVEVKDSETGDVIKEIPSEQSLDLFAKMLEMAGLIIDEKS